MQYIISVRGRGLGHVTPGKFGIPCTVSQKPIKLQTSNLVHSFVVALPTSLYNISERGCGLGHVTPRIFGIPSKTGKAREFIGMVVLALPTSMKDNISERERGLAHVAPEYLAYHRLCLENQ